MKKTVIVIILFIIPEVAHAYYQWPWVQGYSVTPSNHWWYGNKYGNANPEVLVYGQDAHVVWATQYRWKQKVSIELLDGAYAYHHVGYAEVGSGAPPQMEYWHINKFPYPHYTGTYRVKIWGWDIDHWHLSYDGLGTIITPGPEWVPEWKLSVVWPEGEIQPIEANWTPDIVEEGSPPPEISYKKIRCFYSDDEEVYDCEMTKSANASNGFIMDPITTEGAYTIEVHYYIAGDVHEWRLMTAKSFTVKEGAQTYCPWDQSEIDRWIAAAEGSQTHLNEIKAEVEQYGQGELPDIEDDTGTGDPSEMIDFKNGVTANFQTPSWEDLPVSDPFILRLPQVGGGEMDVELQFDPRGWDLGSSVELEKLNEKRVAARVFLVVVLTIYLARKIILSIKRL